MPSLFLPDRKAFLRWDEVGHGDRTVIWLPGIGFPALGNFLGTITDPAMPALRSILVDPLGAGRSTPAGALSLADHADTVAAVIDHLGAGPCAVVGYSMGGAIAAELTLRRPDLVERLILAEGNLLEGGGPGSRHMASVSAQVFAAELLPDMLAGLQAGAVAGDPVDDFILASWGRIDPAALHGMARALVAIRPELEADVLSLSLPRAYIYGAHSLATPGDRVTRNLPDPDRLTAAGFHLLCQQGSGHDLMLRDPAAFATLIAPLLGPEPFSPAPPV